MNMRRGDQQRVKKSNRKMKTPVILIVSLVLLLVVAVGGTAAYLQAASDRVTNTFTPVQVDITPDETTTPETKTNIKFQNTGDVPVYIRATLVIYWKDNAGNIVPQPVGGAIQGGEVQSGWTEKNGIYYYDSAVASKDWTGIMLSEIRVTCPDGYTCHIDVHGEAIQSAGMGATSAQDAWEKAKEEQQ